MLCHAELRSGGTRPGPRRFLLLAPDRACSRRTDRPSRGLSRPRHARNPHQAELVFGIPSALYVKRAFAGARAPGAAVRRPKKAATPVRARLSAARDGTAICVVGSGLERPTPPRSGAPRMGKRWWIPQAAAEAEHCARSRRARACARAPTMRSRRPSPTWTSTARSTTSGSTSASSRRISASAARPIREALTLLEQEGFVRAVPRRGIFVVRKTKREIIEMISGLGRAREHGGQARRRARERSADQGAAQALQGVPGPRRPPSTCTIFGSQHQFHQTIVQLSGSKLIAGMIAEPVHPRAARSAPSRFARTTAPPARSASTCRSSTPSRPATRISPSASSATIPSGSQPMSRSTASSPSE